MISRGMVNLSPCHPASRGCTIPAQEPPTVYEPTRVRPGRVTPGLHAREICLDWEGGWTARGGEGNTAP